MMLLKPDPRRFLTHVGHFANHRDSQRRFAPTLPRFTGIGAPLHRNTQLYVQQPQTSRTTLQFELEFSERSTPTLLLRLKGSDAIEHGEGGEFEILFTGDPLTKFTVQGRVKGSPEGFKELSWTRFVPGTAFATWKRESGCLPYELRMFGNPSLSAMVASPGDDSVEPLATVRGGRVCSFITLFERLAR